MSITFRRLGTDIAVSNYNAYDESYVFLNCTHQKILFLHTVGQRKNGKMKSTLADIGFRAEN